MHRQFQLQPATPPPFLTITMGDLPTNPDIENEGKYKTYLMLMSSLRKHPVFSGQVSRKTFSWRVKLET